MIEQEREWQGTWIPKYIWKHKDLTPTEKFLWAEISNLHSEKHGGCWASNEYLSQNLDSSAGSVANMISKLRKLGLIYDVGFNGRNRIIAAIMPSPDNEPAFTGSLMQPSPLGEPCIHSLVNKYTNRYTNRENKDNKNPHNPPSKGEMSLDEELFIARNSIDEKASDTEGAVQTEKSSDKERTAVNPLFHRILAMRMGYDPNRKRKGRAPDKSEINAWKQISGSVTEHQVALMEKFYSIPRTTSGKYVAHLSDRKVSPSTVMNNWNSMLRHAEDYFIENNIALPDGYEIDGVSIDEPETEMPETFYQDIFKLDEQFFYDNYGHHGLTPEQMDEQTKKGKKFE